MYLDRFEIKNDVLKSFDPRARLGAGVLLIIITVNITMISLLSIILAFCLVVLCRDFVCVLKRLLPLETFCLLFIIQSVFGILRIDRAVIIILRVNCAALIYMITVVPISAGKLLQTLTALKVNKKLVGIFYLSYRFIYLMYDKVMFAVKAMRLRSGTYEKDTIQMWKAYAHVFSTAIVGAFIKADDVTMALQKRGFDNTIPQTVVWVWSVKDTLLIIISCCCIILYGTYKITGRLFFL